MTVGPVAMLGSTKGMFDLEYFFGWLISECIISKV